MRLCLSASGEMLSMVLPDVAALCAATICIIRRWSQSYLEREMDPWKWPQVNFPFLKDCLLFETFCVSIDRAFGADFI